ncbi:hypothetical protein BHE74_00033176 [Ensete ventricosum]|uniref:Uncharacterized protein n=1 Tax=Ensete ventricosum TaxID=4639 RepID=A0A444CBW5_ENSVE|nr:hypothetical protein GW17_00055032 [Ensete ventricosum]RWW59867.1 hypothetical protein BHE74_00033176 [Ensete ventricosum]RZR71833.1 hypothetical protein BHM03_00007747 [Ensete ventricosum]
MPSPLSHYSRAFLPLTVVHSPLAIAALFIPSPVAVTTHYRSRFQPCPLSLPPPLPRSYIVVPLLQPSPFPIAALCLPCRSPRCSLSHHSPSPVVALSDHS